MALSLDDKLLGEKTDYYCSSSEDEGEDEEGGSEEETKDVIPQPNFIPEPDLKDYAGHCTNTGPKGVINDWREFKRLETEKRENQEKERQALMKKLSMTCRSHLDDEKEKERDEDFISQLEELEDEFLKEYRQKRIEEMRKALENVPKFGKVFSLDKQSFVDAIDKEKPEVTIIVHIYEDNVPACEAMRGCLCCLAAEYTGIKFCQLKASDAKLSFKFAAKGVPALLIYKNCDLVGNFIRLSDEFGDDFFAPDVESFLQEHGFLPTSDLGHSTIRDSNTGEVRGSLPEDEDSDFDID